MSASGPSGPLVLFVSLITASKDEQDTSFYRIHCNKWSRPVSIQTLRFPFFGMRIGTQQYVKALCERHLNNQLDCFMVSLSE